MSEFVNYNKRSVSLPKGCKDLVDVLKQQGSSAAKPGKHEEELGKLSDIEKWAIRAFESEADVVQLEIASSERDARFIFHRTPHKKTASVTLRADASAEAAIKVIFERRNLETPTSFGLPKLFFSDSSVAYDLSLAFVDEASFCAIAKDILREVCGLGDQSSLWFRYTELEFVA